MKERIYKDKTGLKDFGCGGFLTIGASGQGHFSWYMAGPIYSTD
jgi:hypothetical protein